MEWVNTCSLCGQKAQFYWELNGIHICNKGRCLKRANMVKRYHECAVCHASIDVRQFDANIFHNLYGTIRKLCYRCAVK